MGFGLSILLHLIFLFIVSSIIAFFSLIITYFISSPEKKKRKLILSIFIPFHIFFSFYIFVFIGSVFISEIKKVDIGIGDSWYAPIDESYQILMIDLPEQAYIECDGKSILSDVSEIQQIEKKVFCKTYNEKYYSINLIEKKLTEYQNIEELKKAENFSKPNLIKVEEFYHKRKWQISGSATIIIGILSLITSILTAIIIYKFIVYGKILGLKK
ncbi:hypothetical protein [Flavobacterium sp.]|uniref:hypothetical protein n=1 Tax=Flavobacterium sp. TaxID=239 RepID=UPI00261CF2D7|nr:hypothetical protein [Flavobacterium sp.]